MNEMIGFAIRYYKDFVLASKKYRKPTSTEKEALADLRELLGAMPPAATAEDVQGMLYEVGKKHFPQLRDWFAALYEILLGQNSGPRMGSFIVLYGIPETVALLNRAIAGEELASSTLPG
jgi:lysyl-tRNA synthetase class 1